MATASFSQNRFPSISNPEKIKIGIAVADWNSHITEKLLQGALETLIELDIKPENVQVLSVPGSFELALGAQMMFDKGYDAVICLGCVIQGDTPHFDYVCKAASEGIMQVGLEARKPCIFGVITTFTEEQALERAGGKHGNKGAEAAITACCMIASKQNLLLH